MHDPIITLFFGAALLGLAAWILEWILRPLLAAARTSKTQRSFILTDLLWLILQLQLAMGVVSSLFPTGASTTSRVWGLVVLSAAVFAFWLASLQAVSQAGIRQPLRRAAVFMIVLPGAIAAFVGVPLLIATLFAELMPAHRPETILSNPRWAAVQLAAGIGGTGLVRWLSAWSVAESFVTSGE